MSRNRLRIIRHAFDPALLKKVREHAIESLSKQTAPTEREEQLSAKGVAVDAVRFDEMWNSIWHTASKELLESLSQHKFLSYPSQVRWIRKREQLVPWHQDYISESHIGQVCTCFVPLDPEPWKHCTLEFAIGDCTAELEHEKYESYKGWKMKEQVFYEYTRYGLCLGDCLVFGDLVPHRSYVNDDMQLERLSLEFRLIGEGDKKPGKDYLNVVSKEHVKVWAP